MPLICRTLRHCRPILALLLPVLATGRLAGQQAIINMPSADITPKGKHFVMHETQVRAWGNGQYWNGTNFYAYGAGWGTELAVTMYNFGITTNRVPNEAVGVGFKKAFRPFETQLPHNELQFTVGSMLIVNTRGQGVGNFSYAHISGRLPTLETRLTAGVSAGTEEVFKKNTVHFIGSVEQPLFHHKVDLVVEWFSGTHDFGFITPGVVYRPFGENFLLVLGYKFANNPANGLNGVVAEIGAFF